MDSLEKFKNMSYKEKESIEDYYVYYWIYDNAKENDIELDDEIVLNLKNIIVNTYKEDFDYGYSLLQITNYVTSRYIDRTYTLNTLNKSMGQDILDAMHYDKENYILKNEKETESFSLEMD